MSSSLPQGCYTQVSK